MEFMTDTTFSPAAALAFAASAKTSFMIDCVAVAILPEVAIMTAMVTICLTRLDGQVSHFFSGFG